MTRSPEDAEEQPIDLDRVVVDSDYRRAVMQRLRAKHRAAPVATGASSKAQMIHED
ncbi:MAG TPA: hypothetical protein VEC75_00400 [Stellaceae bacterium]|nr:hypothetical protein [Stellaceae bacterium]